MRWVVPEAEHMSEGTLGCQGCGGALSMRLVLKEVGRDVEIQDIVHYAMPLWPLGEMVHSISVGKKVEAIFDFRSKALERILF